MKQTLLHKNKKYYPILPGAEPFLFLGKSKPEVGCLLVHGFTGTPVEMHGLGEHLANEGYTALGVRLAGHATSLGDMARTRWTDWFASVRDGYEMLRAESKRVFLIGLSLGGVLSLTLASRYPVDGVVALATPHHLPPDPRLRFVKLIALFKPSIPKGPPDWVDQEAYSRHTCYPADPTRCYAELNELMGVMRAGLSEVKAPVLLINSRQDPIVRADDGHLEAILEGVGSDEKSRLWIEGSGHVITSDAQRQVVYQAVAEFVAKHCNAAG